MTTKARACCPGYPPPSATVTPPLYPAKLCILFFSLSLLSQSQIFFIVRVDPPQTILRIPTCSAIQRREKSVCFQSPNTARRACRIKLTLDPRQRTGILWPSCKERAGEREKVHDDDRVSDERRRASKSCRPLALWESMLRVYITIQHRLGSSCKSSPDGPTFFVSERAHHDSSKTTTML